MSTIYQYCSLNTFMSMAKNRELWLSDITKMNDIREVKELYNLLETELRKITKQIKEKEDKDKKNKLLEDKKESTIKFLSSKKIDSKFEKSITDNFIKEIRKISVEKASKELQCLKNKRRKIVALLSLSQLCKDKLKLITCFSKGGNKLSQWRAYADDGRGISIGFDRKELEKYLKTIGNMNVTITLEDIEYIGIRNIETKLDKILNRLSSEKLEVVGKIFESNEVKTTLEEQIFIDQYIKKMLLLLDDRELEWFKSNFEDVFIKSCFYKNEGFEEEEEVRVLIYEKALEEKEVKEVKEKKDTLKLSEVKYRIKTNNDFIRYRTIEFDEKIFNEIVKEIYIGPKCKVNEEELRIFLNQMNLNKVTINKSLTPYN